MAVLHLGFFESFKPRDTLLLEGDDDGLRKLVDILRSLRNGSTKVIEIDALPFVLSHHGVRLTARRALSDSITRADTSPSQFTWGRSASDWEDAADKVEALLGAGGGHQYFDSGGDAFTVQVSKGEYGADWWKRHG